MTDNPNNPLGTDYTLVDWGAATARVLAEHKAALADTVPTELAEQVQFLLVEIIELRQQLAMLLEEKEAREQEQQDHGNAI